MDSKMGNNLIGKQVIIDTSDPENRWRKHLAPDIHLFERVITGVIEKKIIHSSGRNLHLVGLEERLVDPGRFETDYLILWPDQEGDKTLKDLNAYGFSEVVLSYVPIGKQVPDQIDGYGEFPSFGVGKLYLKDKAPVTLTGKDPKGQRVKLWKIGLLTVLLGGLVNAVLMQNQIGGLIRELTRLTIWIGFFLLIFGIFKKNK